MSVPVNSESRVPPGFRFHPTEEELLHYYLRKKVEHQKIDLDVIQAVDLNKLEPWDIQEKCKIGSTPQNEWYFFSHKDKKYPTGKRTNRATAAGFWKATGRDKAIYTSFKRIGMRKTLVFYKGRAPHGEKTDWIMHEYRLSDLPQTNSQSKSSSSSAETIQDDVWVVCRVFKKKSHHKMFKTLKSSTIAEEIKIQVLNSSSEGAMNKILPHMACTGTNDSMASKTKNTIVVTKNNKSNINSRCSSSCSNQKNMRSSLTPIETTTHNGFQVRFMQLPSLESPTLPTFPNVTTAGPVDIHVVPNKEASVTNNQGGNLNANPVHHPEPGLNDWASLDRLIASHLNGQAETSKQLAYLYDPDLAFTSGLDYGGLPLPGFRSTPSDRLFNGSHDYNSDIDLWNFTRSASFPADALFDMSNSSL